MQEIRDFGTQHGKAGRQIIMIMHKTDGNRDCLLRQGDKIHCNLNVTPLSAKSRLFAQVLKTDFKVVALWQKEKQESW